MKKKLPANGHNPRETVSESEKRQQKKRERNGVAALENTGIE